MGNTEKKRGLLGILGGLGPLSSAYFYELITQHTKASCDQDHIDIILSSRASTPDRTSFILHRSEDDPLEYMIEDAKKLEKYGADAIVIPCNTAHYFIDEVRNSVNVPVPSIISETCSHIRRNGYRKACILATEGTICSGAYQNELEKMGIEWVIPDGRGQECLMDIIYNDVKRGIIPPKEKLMRVVSPLIDSGCDCAILGCTELSLLKKNMKEDAFFIDSLEVLAACAIRMFDREATGFSADFNLEAAR